LRLSLRRKVEAPPGPANQENWDERSPFAGAVEGLFDAPLPVQKAFIKQINYLVRNLSHPSLRAKKFDEAKGRWQARVNDDWRFYFTIERDTYRISEIIQHPK
jgi:hypothetical protein